MSRPLNIMWLFTLETEICINFAHFSAHNLEIFTTLTFVCQRTEQQQIQWWCCVTSTGTHREDGGLDTVWQLISEQLTSSDSSGALSPLCLPATRPSQSRSTHKLLLLQPLDPQDTAQPPSTHTVLFTLSSTKTPPPSVERRRHQCYRDSLHQLWVSDAAHPVERAAGTSVLFRGGAASSLLHVHVLEWTR